MSLRLGLIAIACCLGAFTQATSAAGAAVTKLVHYHGYRLAVPSGWPVYRLGLHSRQCVRFDRHAVYLGRPGAAQVCPAHAAGRTEAILVQPLSRQSRAGESAGGGSSLELVNASASVVVTATWRDQPTVIKRALGVRSLRGRPRIARSAAASASAQAGGVYTGLGFDACAAPSVGQMSAWGSSPYRAIGVYIGGTNMACSQANLTPTWVSQESAAGWHMIPTYVGLQAPTNSCGCAAISPGSASTQGAAAAADAIVQAQALGLGPGNPIYFDMEAYPRGATNTSAVLAFLASWTSQLHAGGYASGVYSSADSGILDLATQQGTGYLEPDDIWIARWNDAKNTSDPNVPSTAWPVHQRLHQYSGAHDESYGGVTINIDGDYVDGEAAAAGGGAPPVAAAPSLSISPTPDGGIGLFPNWSGVSAVTAWQVTAGPTPDALAPAANPISVGAKPPIVIHSAFPYFAVQALNSAGQLLGSSAPVATPAHVAIFGRSAFVAPRGTGGLPVGCFNSSPCHLTTTISAGRTVLAKTGSEQIPVGGGLAYFTITRAAATLLARAHGRRLAVRIAVRDASGLSATRQLSLIPFATSGASAHRAVRQSSQMWVIGTTDFVSHGWVGGILAACVSGIPCHPTVTIAAGGATIARTGQQFMGVNQLGYLFFSLSAAGHRMLTESRGNQLPAEVTITTAGSTATARIALVSFR